MASLAVRFSPLGAEVARRYAAPAQKRVTKARRFAEAQHFCDFIDRQLVLGQQLLGAFESQLIEQLLVAAAQLLQMPSQCAR